MLLIIIPCNYTCTCHIHNPLGIVSRLHVQVALPCQASLSVGLENEEKRRKKLIKRVLITNKNNVTQNSSLAGTCKRPPTEKSSNPTIHPHRLISQPYHSQLQTHIIIQTTYYTLYRHTCGRVNSTNNPLLERKREKKSETTCTIYPPGPAA